MWKCPKKVAKLIFTKKSAILPDCSSINLAEKSDQPEDWLLHPTGFVFKFDAQKAQPISEQNDPPKVVLISTQSGQSKTVNDAITYKDRGSQIGKSTKKENFELLRSALNKGTKITSLNDILGLQSEVKTLMISMIEKVENSTKSELEGEILNKLKQFL